MSLSLIPFQKPNELTNSLMLIEVGIFGKSAGRTGDLFSPLNIFEMA